jgi:hypothetical protein
MSPAPRASLLVWLALFVSASLLLGGSPACETCKDEPQVFDFAITPDQFHAGSVPAGDATSYEQWRDALAADPCQKSCNQLINQNPITVTACTTSSPGSSPLVIHCAWTLHACDQNPGCSG